jgi:hypothetical protein
MNFAMKLLTVTMSLLSFAVANQQEAPREVSRYQAVENHVSSKTVEAGVAWELVQWAGLGCTGNIVGLFSGIDPSVCLNFAGTVGAQSFEFFGDNIPLEFFELQGCGILQDVFENIDGECFSLQPGFVGSMSFEVL